MLKIKLTQDKFALIDASDRELINQYEWWAWYTGHAWYAVSYIQNKSQSMHRFIMGLKWKDGRCVDHINHNGLDNRRSNLRIATHSQNMHNIISKQGSSQYKGVVFKSELRKWTAQIKVGNKIVHLGCFAQESDAAKMYDKIAIKEWGEFAYTNFPRGNYSSAELLSVQEVIEQRKINKSSRYIGVCWRSDINCWRVVININGKLVNLGHFELEIDAAKARDSYVKKHKLNRKFNFNQ